MATSWWTSSPLRLLVILLILVLLPVCHGKYERAIVTDRDLNRRKEACYIDIENWKKVKLISRGAENFELVYEGKCRKRKPKDRQLHD